MEMKSSYQVYGTQQVAVLRKKPQSKSRINILTIQLHELTKQVQHHREGEGREGWRKG